MYGVESESVSRGALEQGIPKEFVRIFSSHEAISEELSLYLSQCPLILVKGSRGMKMEKVLERLKKE
ncbi:MAG: hypothetical protein HYR80_00015 [Nitrospirae bacterium]|nr:hypothetical protein [Nitrospirota bacterium]